MSNQNTPVSYYYRLELVKEESFEYILRTLLPITIDGKLCNNTNILVRGYFEKSKERLELTAQINIYKETFHRSPRTQEEADEARGFTMLIPQFRKFLDGEEYEYNFSHLGVQQNFKKYDNGYYLEEIRAEHLLEPLSTVRQKALSGSESKGYSIFYFSDDTHSKIVDIFNKEKDIITQLGL